MMMRQSQWSSSRIYASLYHLYPISHTHTHTCRRATALIKAHKHGLGGVSTHQHANWTVWTEESGENETEPRKSDNKGRKSDRKAADWNKSSCQDNVEWENYKKKGKKRGWKIQDFMEIKASDLFRFRDKWSQGKLKIFQKHKKLFFFWSLKTTFFALSLTWFTRSPVTFKWWLAVRIRPTSQPFEEGNIILVFSCSSTTKYIDINIIHLKKK